MERKDQDDNHKEDGQDADQHVVVFKGGLQVAAACGIAHKVIFIIVPGNDAVENVQIFKALLPLGGQVHLQHDAAPFFAFQLELGVVELLLQILHALLRLLREIDGHLVLLGT